MEDNLNLHMKDNVLKCCLTIDGWTSSSQESFMGITCHYIDENFATKSVVLNLKHLNENHNEQSKMIFKLYTDKDPMLSFFIIASTSFQNPGKERRRYTENSKLFK